jgi:Ca2+/Na+ antiporter
LILTLLAVVIVPLDVGSRIVKREAPIVLAAVILLGIFVRGGGLNRIEGLVSPVGVEPTES